MAMLPSFNNSYNTWTTATRATTSTGSSTGSSTGTSSYDTQTWYTNDATGGTDIRTYGYEGYGMEPHVPDHTYAISKEVTKKDLKAMKDEIRKYMQDQMLDDAKEIAGQLFEEIAELKKEKTQLKESVAELKTQVEQVQAYVKSELEALEDLLERRSKEIIKFSHMDFSQS